MRNRTLITALAYQDTQDPGAEGWAYRLTFDDGHEESGPLDSGYNDPEGAASELGALVVANGGADADELTVDDDGSYRWTRADVGTADDE